MDKPKDQLDTDEREAIRDEVRAEVVDEVTAELRGIASAPDDSSERIRRLSRNEVRPLLREAIAKHASECEHEGPLCVVAAKVDVLRISSYKQNAVLAFLAVVMPIVLGIWLNNRANDRLSQQLSVAADVARQLKAVQDAAGGHTMNLDTPTHLAQRSDP